MSWDDVQPYVVGGVRGLLLAALFAFLFLPSKQPARIEGASKVVGASWKMRVLTIVTWFIPVILFTVSQSKYSKQSESCLYYIMELAFIVAAITMTWITFYWRLEWDREGVRRIAKFATDKQIYWDEVTEFGVSAWRGEYYISGGKATIYINPVMDGAADLLTSIDQRFGGGRT